MKILLTGITGHLHSWFIQFLQNHYSTDHEYYVIMHKNNANFPVPIHIIQQDLLSKFSLEISLDILIHSATILPFYNTMTEKECIQLNLSLTKNLLDSFKYPPGKIIFFSTHAIHQSHYHALNYWYAVSKLEQEKLIIKYCKENDISYVIVRFPPFIENITDFQYDIRKLKKLISFFPFSLNEQIIFLSNKDTFSGILEEMMKDHSKNFIVKFEFSEQFTYKDKLIWLKKNLNLKTPILSLPIKTKYPIIEDIKDVPIKKWLLTERELLIV